MGLTESIRRENAAGRLAVIADVKCASPQHGDLLRGRDPVAVAASLATAGAAAISVVTEAEHYAGSPQLLADVARSVDLPVLRKDFLTSERDIVQTAKLGASAVLLMCAVLDKTLLTRLYDKALSVGLEPLVEVHTRDELAFATSLGVQMIGFNNRDITVFETDDGGVSQTLSLAEAAPPGAVLISESGIAGPTDALALADAGIHAALVGTALWQADDMAGLLTFLRVRRPEGRPAKR